MLTVLESITLSEDYLKKKGIESARVNAELLLADILNCKRLDLYLKFDQPLSEKEINKYREYISRRGKNEPLQYILGKVEFYGLTLKVDRSVLIPRPETELLVELILEETDKESVLNILDIGCGSGNISLALAKDLPLAKITGADISPEAISLARENAKMNNITGNVEFIEVDIFNDVSGKVPGKFDIIVSNPPYVSKNDFEKLQPEIKNYEPQGAVTDFSDGYSFYRRIINLANELLKPSGKLYFEVAEGQSGNIKNLLEENNFVNISVKKDFAGIERIISGEKG